MPISTVIDPAHGGGSVAGRSTPFGARGVTGILEKDVTLGIARRVAAHLGEGARLTREADVNLSLGERALVARQSGAPAFVSLHAGEGDGGGPEVWVHTRSSARSAALADSVARELGRFGARVRRGDFAVLHPNVHPPEQAACIVELGGLGHAEGERRLRDPHQVEAIAQAIARGVRGFLGSGQRAYGYVARGLELNLTDFDEGQFNVYPDDQIAGYPARVTRAELDSIKAAWDRMMNGQGVEVTAPADSAHATQFRKMLCDCMVTSKVVRDAFRFVVASPTTLQLEVGRNNGLFVDGFEWKASSSSSQRGWHSLDLDDFDMIPRTSSQQHHYICTRSHVLIHALIEAGNGVRSAIADGGARYRASHQRAIDEENRYRAEQGMLGTKDYLQPLAVGGDFEFHFASAGADVSTETWHMAPGWQISSITYSP